MLHFFILESKRKKIGRFFFNSKKNESSSASFVYNLLEVSDLSILFNNVLAALQIIIQDTKRNILEQH